VLSICTVMPSGAIICPISQILASFTHKRQHHQIHTCKGWGQPEWVYRVVLLYGVRQLFGGLATRARGAGGG